MPTCTECSNERLDEDLLFDKDKQCWLCRFCFVGELVGNIDRNKALSAASKHFGAVGGAAAHQAANLLFNKMRDDQRRGKHRPKQEESLGK